MLSSHQFKKNCFHNFQFSLIDSKSVCDKPSDFFVAAECLPSKLIFLKAYTVTTIFPQQITKAMKAQSY